MRSWVKGAIALSVLLSFTIAGLPVAANPMVPMCGPASVAGGSSETAGNYDPALCEATTGRVFPEAIADNDYISATGPRGFTGGSTGFATDYVSYFEFQQGLGYLAAQYPDFIEVHEVAMSRGNEGDLLGTGSYPVYMLEISNEKSPIPRDEKQNLLFMLSIHGNEKGGREGGFRVVEDLLRNIGFATETVQNGAGLNPSIARPTGEGNVETYHDMLDFMNIFLLFPNTDGWSCDEIQFSGGTDGCAGLFRRTNGAGIDMNRQTPTIGWNRQGSASHEAVKEPEPVGYLNWMVEQRTQSNGTFQWDYAIDIHGMLNHKNFGAIMLPAGSFSPQEMYRSLGLAATLKDRWNQDAEDPNGHFYEWASVFAAAETAWDASAPGRDATKDGFYDGCNAADPLGFGHCALAGSALYDDNPAHAASSSQFAEYYTVIDAIGYTDSGFSGDFFAQTTGLNAPGYDIELAYNHLVAGAQYEVGALWNDYHVHMVRHIVKSFMDAAALDGQISYETGGLKTAYVNPQYVATNLDDVDADGNPKLTPGGWADQNPGDDAWDYGADQPFEARPAKYWEDMAAFVCENCGTADAIPGVLARLNAAGVGNEKFAKNLANFDNIVIPGTAINQFVDGTWGANEVATGTVDSAKVDAVMAWVENGGNLVLTDAGLKFLDLSGVTKDAVNVEFAYMGGIRMDLDHELLNKIRGGVKQTYEPTPLGFGVTGTAPNWGVNEAAFTGAGGSIAGRVCGGSQLTQNCDNKDVALGYIPVGTGRITIIGALLPDPTEEFYHPYGLDHYATTFSGNQVLRNALGWDEKFAAPPITLGADGKIIQTANERAPTTLQTTEDVDGPDSSKKNTPGLGLVALVATLALLGAVRRR